MRLRIEFHGLCLVATDTGKFEPEETDIVTILLPENTPRHAYRDGTFAVQHHPNLLIPKSNVPDPGSFDVVTSTGQGIEYVVVPLQKMDVSFDPAPARPAIMPNGENTTLGLSRVIDFDWFTDALELSPLVKPMHAERTVHPHSPAAQLVATRVQLQKGYFYTVDAAPEAYRWRYEAFFSRDHKYPPAYCLSLQLLFDAEMPESFELVLTPFDGSDPNTLQIVDAGADEILMQLGNECLDPRDWDNPKARCDPDSPDPGPVVRDTDFKAYYDLLESTEERTIELRLDGRELPVPSIAALALAMAGSEWCQRGLIQVPPESSGSGQQSDQAPNAALRSFNQHI